MIGIIPAVSWNKDGQILSAFNQNTSEVSLYTVDSRSAICSGIFKIPGNVTCLEFCKTNSRYLAIGDSKDQILIWDVKGNYKKKSYTVPKSCITNLSFSSSDSHLAVGTVHGDAFTISNTNNLVSSPIKVFLEKTEVKDIRYSMLNRSIVGVCGGNGYVALYDAITSKVFARHNSHSAPVSNVAFSPINELLMISVGYDKKLISYDVNTKSIVMKCETENPLTCISFMTNGQSVAVGTMKGEVIVYDLRMLSHPLYKTKAYKGPVYDLKFQPCRPLEKLKVSKRRPKNIIANEDKAEANCVDKSRASKIKEDSFVSYHTDSSESAAFEILSPVNSQVSKEKEYPKNIPLLKNMKTPARPIKQMKEYNDFGLLSPLDKENRSPIGKLLGSAKPLIMEGSPRSNASSSVKSSANDSTHKIMNSLEKSVPNLEDDILLSSQKNNSEQRKSICQEGFLNTSKSRNHEKSLSDELQNSSADRVKKNLLKDLEIKSPSPTKNSSVPLENLANTTEDEKFEEAVRLAFPHGDCEPPGILDNLGIDDAPGTSLNINVEIRNFIAEIIEKYDCRSKR
ncbi:Protein NEDD1 [Armadillidium vulgare]|nr:Protein NEDD1 [Armadillidium vulgare]